MSNPRLETKWVYSMLAPQVFSAPYLNRIPSTPASEACPNLQSTFAPIKQSLDDE